MISRLHGLVLSLLLGAAAAAGAYAVIDTAHLGDAQTKPEVVSSNEIAKRADKLDAWQVSLAKALKARPPALPPLNRYAAVTYVSGPGAATLPSPVAPATRTVQEVQQPPKPTAKPSKKLSRPHPKAISEAGSRTTGRPKPVVARAEARDDAQPRTTPATTTEPEHDAPAPVVVAAAPAAQPAAAPAPAHRESPAPVAQPQPQPSQPPATLSVEQQCRALLRAAEGKSEQVKQDAEKQCEALKNAAEKRG